MEVQAARAVIKPIKLLILGRVSELTWLPPACSLLLLLLLLLRLGLRPAPFVPWKRPCKHGTNNSH
jgi:hypothetical protein